MQIAHPGCDGLSRVNPVNVYVHKDLGARSGRTALTSAVPTRRITHQVNDRIGSTKQPDKDGYAWIEYMARPAGLEPATLGFEARCSIQLSQERAEGAV